MKKVTITLATGKNVAIEKDSYVVQAWHNGGWHNIAAFPHTSDGYELAACVLHTSTLYLGPHRIAFPNATDKATIAASTMDRADGNAQVQIFN